MKLWLGKVTRRQIRKKLVTVRSLNKQELPLFLTLRKLVPLHERWYHDFRAGTEKRILWKDAQASWQHINYQGCNCQLGQYIEVRAWNKCSALVFICTRVYCSHFHRLSFMCVCFFKIHELWFYLYCDLSSSSQFFILRYPHSIYLISLIYTVFTDSFGSDSINWSGFYFARQVLGYASTDEIKDEQGKNRIAGWTHSLFGLFYLLATLTATFSFWYVHPLLYLFACDL